MPTTFVFRERGVFVVDVTVPGFQLLEEHTILDAAATDIIGETGKQQLSQLHYYPNQRSVCPVKQIIIRD